MEPMCLSSSPKAPASPGSNPNFLPPFLMGSNQNQPTSPNASSPLAHNKSVSFKAPQNVEPKTLRQKLFQETVNESHFTTFDSVNIDKGGPPKCGLFDTLNSNKPTTPIMSSTMKNQMEPTSFSFNESFVKANESMGMAMAMGNQVQSPIYNNSFAETTGNPFYNSPQQQERVTSCWVTVFGFPPSAASLVLAQFSNFGTILEKQFPSQGNWVNIKYSSTFEAAKALSMHGKLISNCIMVAVMPFNNKNNKENQEANSFISPSHPRSLRHTFVTPRAGNEVVQAERLPQKSTGLVSKAMEYIFGW